MNATKESQACQRDFLTRGFTGSEDCLHLNVYTKMLSADDKKTLQPQSAKTSDNESIDKSHKSSKAQQVPVMVFFHGGAFMFGSNAKDLYNPEYLLRKDIVLVVVNYRLGSLGKFVIRYYIIILLIQVL